MPRGQLRPIQHSQRRTCADALGRAGGTDGAKLRDAIAATSGFDGVTGRISMDEKRNARKDAVVLEIAGGKFRYHKTVSAD